MGAAAPSLGAFGCQARHQCGPRHGRHRPQSKKSSTRREAHIPTQPTSPGEEARLPRSHAHPVRPRRDQGPPSQGPDPAGGLIWRIRDRRAFQQLARSGRRARTRTLWCSYLNDPSAVPLRVGFAVGRAVGTAATRNRVRRRLRAIVATAAARPRRRTRLVADRRHTGRYQTYVRSAYRSGRPSVRPGDGGPRSAARRRERLDAAVAPDQDGRVVPASGIRAPVTVPLHAVVLGLRQGGARGPRHAARAVAHRSPPRSGAGRSARRATTRCPRRARRTDTERRPTSRRGVTPDDRRRVRRSRAG